MKASVHYNSILAGYLSKDGSHYFFQYDENYLADNFSPAISITLPKQKEVFTSEILFPFFYGLLAEGENKDLQCRLLHIDERDHFGRLLKTGMLDTIGGITVRETND